MIHVWQGPTYHTTVPPTVVLHDIFSHVCFGKAFPIFCHFQSRHPLTRRMIMGQFYNYRDSRQSLVTTTTHGCLRIIATIWFITIEPCPHDHLGVCVCVPLPPPQWWLMTTSHRTRQAPGFTTSVRTTLVRGIRDLTGELHVRSLAVCSSSFLAQSLIHCIGCTSALTVPI